MGYVPINFSPKWNSIKRWNEERCVRTVITTSENTVGFFIQIIRQTDWQKSVEKKLQYTPLQYSAALLVGAWPFNLHTYTTSMNTVCGLGKSQYYRIILGQFTRLCIVYVVLNTLGCLWTFNSMPYCVFRITNVFFGIQTFW